MASILSKVEMNLFLLFSFFSVLYLFDCQFSILCCVFSDRTISYIISSYDKL